MAGTAHHRVRAPGTTPTRRALARGTLLTALCLGIGALAAPAVLAGPPAAAGWPAAAGPATSTPAAPPPSSPSPLPSPSTSRAPSASPKPSATPKPTTSPKPSASPRPTSSPKPTTSAPPSPSGTPAPGPRATFTDTCAGVTTTVTNPGPARDTVTLIRRQRGVDPTGSVPGQRGITLRPGQSRTATVAPVNGRGFSLRWQSDSVLGIGDGFHTWRRPADCDGGGHLPTTGSAAANTAILGGLLVLAGLPAVWFFRRRRPTTPA